LAPSANLSVLSEITKIPTRPPPAPTTRLAVFPFFIVDTVDSTFRYAPIGYSGGWSATLPEAVSRAAIGIEVTSWTVRLASTLTAGQSVSFRFVVDGVPDAGIVVTISSGQDSGRANGSLTIPVGALVAIEGVVGGTLSSVSVLGGIVGYRGNSFLTTIADFGASLPHNMNLEGYFGVGDGANFTSLGSEPRVTLSPINATLAFDQLAAQISATLGADMIVQPQVGGVNAGASVTVPLGQLGASGAVAFSAGRAVVPADLQTVKMSLHLTGSGSPARRITASYQFGSPFQNWSFVASGFSASQNLSSSIGNADAWQAFGSTLAQLVSESIQLRWPSVPGTLQHFAAVRITNNPAASPATFRYRLRLNGATAIEVVEVGASSNPGLALEDATAVTVVADDLVNFATHSDGPYSVSNQSRVLYAIGFLPS
jgi:hypothetical protein